MDLDNSFSPRGGRGGGGRGRGGRGNLKGNAYVGSPSTSVTESPGRGRGRGRGGGSGFRGRGGASLRADYTAVPPIDYSRINKENYKTMTGQFSLSAQRSPSYRGIFWSRKLNSRHRFALCGFENTSVLTLYRLYPISTRPIHASISRLNTSNTPSTLRNASVYTTRHFWGNYS